MSDLIALPLPNGRWLALEPEQFKQALAAGSALIGPRGASEAAPAGDEQLVDAEQLANVLNLPTTWIERAAREKRIPSIKAGRWRRYKRSDVEHALAANGRGA